MEYKIQESILVNKKIEKIESIIETIICEINGKITQKKSEYILWSCKYALQTIKHKTYLISHEKNTEIVIMVDSDYLGLTGSKKIVKDFKKALLQDSKIKLFIPIPKDQQRLTGKDKESKTKKNKNKTLPEFSKKPISSQSYINNGGQQKTDPFAIVAFAAGLGGFVILPILFIPIGYIASILSYYRLKENKELQGSGIRIVGSVLTTINILWLMYQFKIGVFNIGS